MGFLDRFRNQQPSKTPRGESGRGHVDGFLALEELNVELRGRQGLTIFDRMYRTDPDVRRNVAMAANPVIGGTWNVEPYGGDEAEDKDREVADFVYWTLMHGMRPTLPRHLAQLLPMLMRSGFTPFEPVWGTSEWNGKTVLIPKTLGMRLPRTIAQFKQDDAGELTELVQWTPRGGNIKLPATDLVYYRLGAEGDNWEGTSLLRPVYKPWFLKDKIEKLAAIGVERESTGIPLAYPPANVSDEVLDDVEEVLANIRTNEQGYIVSPGPKAEHSENGQGWHFEILSANSGEKGGKNVEALLNYFSGKISAAFIAEFMDLGQKNVGARATADVQQDPFLAGVEALAGEIESTLNEQLVNRIVALNYDVDEPPTLKMSLVDSTSLEQLASYVSDLVAAEAFHPDDDLEDYLREKADLPPASAEEREARKKAGEAAREALAQAGNQPPGNQPPPKPGDPPVPQPTPPAPTPPVPEPKEEDDVQPLPWGRELRWWEKKLKLDVIDSAIGGARDRLEHAAGEQTREIARTYAAAALAGKHVMPKPGDELASAIATELEYLYLTGEQTVISELAAQKPDGASVAGVAIEDAAKGELRRRAALIAQSIATRIWQAVSRSALNRPGDQAATQAAGETEAAAALRAEAQLHASGVLNAGRTAAANDHSDEIAGSRYTSILDKNRCEACRAADDDVLRPLDDPVRLARIPPNSNCYGGGRCRCIEFFEYSEESGSGGGGSQPPPPPAPIAPVPKSPSVAQHFDISGGNAELRQLVTEQLGAIQAVHDMPAMMPVIPIKLTSMQKAYGQFSGAFRYSTSEWSDVQIKLSASALSSTPPITSAVHEIGHFLDAFGFGQGAPREAILADSYLSSLEEMREWREATVQSNAVRQLTLNGGTPYETSVNELLARSYEQWIATRSGNAVLTAKIARRRQDNRNLYWEDGDFLPIGRAFDAFFAARGLLRTV